MTPPRSGMDPTARVLLDDPELAAAHDRWVAASLRELYERLPDFRRREEERRLDAAVLGPDADSDVTTTVDSDAEAAPPPSPPLAWAAADPPSAPAAEAESGGGRP